MSMDEAVCPASPVDQVQRLRKELKDWEKAFSTANSGRKAGRDDIKQNPLIAQKYKDYNRLCGRQAQRASRALSPSTPATKKRRLAQPDTGKSPKRAHFSHPADIDPYDLPLHLTPVAVRTCIAPTPQKNGQVLGLFDLLSPPANRPSPSKPSLHAEASFDLQATPSKRKTLHSLSSNTNTPKKDCQTPRSSSAQRVSNKFLTPTTIRFNGKVTPRSRKPRYDLTPEFLRRESNQYAGIKLSSVDEALGEQAEATSFSPFTIRVPPRPVGKSLSALVQGLRSMEEDRLDEELDMLREMEDEENGVRPAPMPKKPRIIVEDSQPLISLDVRLGPDGEVASSDDDTNPSDGIGLDGRPMKAWKKKGQKRTTRKANIKPSMAKWKPERVWEAGKENDSRTEDNDIPNQQPGSNELADDGNGGSAAAVGKKGVKSGRVRTIVRENFRALKLRNKTAQGSKRPHFRKKR